ncbi:MAG: hypothetical protein ACP5NX_00425 [Candidatus Bilamarchaeaceae archaeon]
MDRVRIISSEERESLMEEFCAEAPHRLKVDIHGTCIKLFTDSHDFWDMAGENFYPMDDRIRPHGRLFSITGKRKGILYEPLSKTVFMTGFDYYGKVKSTMLALAADFLEDFTSEHRRYSIHGSYVDCKGRGIGMIGVSGAGKTTLTYGLLQEPGYNFVTDDWFFVRFMDSEALVFSSERNSYVRDTLAKDWPAFKKRLVRSKKDSYGRTIADVRMLAGEEKIRQTSVMEKIVLLVRDKGLPPEQELGPKEALSFMLKNGFCNPHSLVNSREKVQKRKAFFHELFRKLPVVMLNTVETPKESLARLEKQFAGI